MMYFIKHYEFEVIKKKLLLLYILNVTDIIFTFILIRAGFCIERNKLMIPAVEDPLLGFLLKILLPAILVLYLHTRMKTASDNELKQSNILLNIITILYALINISHLTWLILVPLLTT